MSENQSHGASNPGQGAPSPDGPGGPTQDKDFDPDKLGDDAPGALNPPPPEPRNDLTAGAGSGIASIIGMFTGERRDYGQSSREDAARRLAEKRGDHDEDRDGDGRRDDERRGDDRRDTDRGDRV